MKPLPMQWCISVLCFISFSFTSSTLASPSDSLNSTIISSSSKNVSIYPALFPAHLNSTPRFLRMDELNSHHSDRRLLAKRASSSLPAGSCAPGQPCTNGACCSTVSYASPSFIHLLCLLTSSLGRLLRLRSILLQFHQLRLQLQRHCAVWPVRNSREPEMSAERLLLAVRLLWDNVRLLRYCVPGWLRWLRCSPQATSIERQWQLETHHWLLRVLGERSIV